MLKYKLSIGVPVYNVSKYIEKCARSIFSQTYDNLEIIFVDDCSPDDSIEIVQKVLQDYPHRQSQTKILSHEKNSGVSAARNTFLDNMTGDFFMFVDADDYITPESIEKLVACQRRYDSDITSGTILQDSDGTKKTHPKNTSSTIDEWLRICCEKDCCHAVFSRIYRSTLVSQPVLRYRPDVTIGEDWIFMVEILLRANSFYEIDDIVYIYNYNNQQSAMHSIEKNRCHWLLMDCYTLKEISTVVGSRSASLREASLLQMLQKLEHGLCCSANQHNKVYFDKFKKLLPDLEPVKDRHSPHFNKLSIKGNPYYVIFVACSWYISAKSFLTKPFKETKEAQSK